MAGAGKASVLGENLSQRRGGIAATNRVFHRRDAEALRKTKSKSKPERAEGAEGAEGWNPRGICVAGAWVREIVAVREEPAHEQYGLA